MKTETEIQLNRSLSEFTTYRIGGPADKFVIPRSLEELRQTLAAVNESGESKFILGGGSNLLISDRGIRGVVILMTGCCREIEAERLNVYSGAGASLSELVDFTLQRGIGGIERLAGIPGTLGGALRMNAGAYGAEISDYLLRVITLEDDGAVKTVSRAEADFAYRRAPGLEDALIVGAEFEFKLVDKTGVAETAAEILQLRASKHPLEFPSAGSVFKKHFQGPAGKFIEEADLKGMRIGGAEVSTKHANFIVNRRAARAIEVLTLIRKIQRIVWEKFSVKLELEQKLVGFTEEELNQPERFL